MSDGEFRVRRTFTEAPTAYKLSSSATNPSPEPSATSARIDANTARRRVSSHHSGEELLFVLSGSITLRLVRREEILEAGDGAHFNAVIPHKVTCTKGSRAQVLIVILPDGTDEPAAAPAKAKGR